MSQLRTNLMTELHLTRKFLSYVRKFSTLTGLYAIFFVITGNSLYPHVLFRGLPLYGHFPMDGAYLATAVTYFRLHVATLGLLFVPFPSLDSFNLFSIFCDKG